jgi:hypothetical protein
MDHITVRLRMTSQLVIRESDARTLFLIAVYAGKSETPMLVQVVEPPDDE